MARAFADKQSIVWLVALCIVVFGFFIAALVLPAVSKTPGTDQPDIHVPKMQNVPPADAPKMRLDTGKTNAD